MNRPSTIAAALATACLVAVSAPGDAAAPAPIGCRFVAVGATPASRGSILCASVANEGVRLDISRDAGRTWTSRTAMVPVVKDWLEQVTLSPGYPADHTIYARYYQTGLFRSTDDGATFTLVDPFGSTHGRPVRMTPLPGYVLGGLLGGANDAVALGQSSPAVVVNGTSRPVGGSGDQVDLEFLTVGGAVLDISEGPSPELRRRTTIYRCTPALVCADRRVVLPESFVRAGTGSDRAADGRTVAVFARSELGPPGTGLWLSHDGGGTFTRNAALQPVLDRLRATADITGAVAVVRVGSRPVVVLRITSTSPKVTMDTLYRSFDGGATWQHVRPRGLADRASEPWLVGMLDGHLLSTNSSGSLLCSSDQGETWGVRCR